DCAGSQECVAGVCLEAAEATVWRTDGGAGIDGGTSIGPDGGAGDAGAAGDETGGKPDAPIPTYDSGTASGLDGAGAGDVPLGGQTDAPTAIGDVPQVPDLQPIDWGPAGSDASITVTAVAEPTSARPGEEIAITVAGAGVADPKNLTLGGLLADKVTISEATSVSFKAKLSVPHGLAPAIVDLGFSCRGGQATASAVLQVTPIAVSIEGDDTNRGTPDNPFRTVTKAVQTAGVGDTIQVGSGEFVEGETWPELPHKVTLVGAGVSSTFFNVTGSSCTRISFVGDAVVRDVALTGRMCGFSIAKPQTTVYLEDVAKPKVECDPCTNEAYNSSLYVDSRATGAQVTIAGSQTWLPRDVIVRATNVALVLRDGMIDEVYAPVTGLDLRVEGATMGNVLEARSIHTVISLTGAANVVLDRATLNGEMAVESGSTVRAKDTSFKASTGEIGLTTWYVITSGRDVLRGSANGRLTATLTNCTFDGGGTQLQVAKDDDVVLRGCKFLNYERTGLYLIGEPAKLDLGTATDLGGNEFTGSTASGVYGYQDDRAAAGQTVTISGTKFNGVTPPAGLLTKSATETACQVGAYCIKTDGNSITFF
ncbi:MAG: DUF1565 domain-containing protein, partial [Deltaproteobacteria bacterium]|nr:DUF1565 domain-containing protein [Deltaproteobacteria bacterium]